MPPARPAKLLSVSIGAARVYSKAWPTTKPAGPLTRPTPPATTAIVPWQTKYTVNLAAQKPT